MKKKKQHYKDKRIKNSLFSFWRFLSIFAFVAFVVTCSFLLFFQGANLTQIFIPQGMIKYRALNNFGNVLFLSFVISIIDSIRKKIVIEKPVKRILDATHRVTKGDFTTRIEPIHSRLGIDEFDVIIDDFNKMIKELSSIETLKTDFIANVSHELKTPLAIIQNYSTMLQDPELSEEKRIDYANSLSEASGKLSELITSILRLNKLENQQIFPKYEKYNLSEQLCECLLQFEQDWEKKNINIITDFDDEFQINADAELMNIVWSNLISNAVKFNKENGTISVSAKKEGNKAVVRISDTGCGMTKETGMHIFEKFYQGDSSRTTRGNGLGLALVKRVIDITKGEITTTSEVGVGTTFTVRLPL